MNFKLWLLEELQTDEIKTIMDQISSTISPVVNAQLLRDALGSKQSVNLTPNAKESPGGKLYKQPELIFNLSRFIGRNNPVKDAEILSLGLQNGGYVTLFLGHMQNGIKIANIGRTGDLLDTGIIGPVTNILKSLGYRMFTHPKDLQPVSEDSVFVDDLTSIFRIVASLKFHQDLWPTLVPKIEALKVKHPQEWIKYHTRLRQTYGDKPTFYRSLGLPDNGTLIKIGSKETITAADARVGDKVYYPAKWPVVIVQMTELPEHLTDSPENVESHYMGTKGDEAGHVWGGAAGPFGSSIQIILRCEVPIERLLIASTPMLAGASPTVKENEVIVKVESDISSSKRFGEDFGIPCTIVTHSKHGSKSRLGHTTIDKAEREKLYQQGKSNV